ncbi:MAG: hypothetical protein HY901_04285 [Deltaproteobacteria bacterium]|nr:hypothetical protein [Deltaproteobacteria bacterium]
MKRSYSFAAALLFAGCATPGASSSPQASSQSSEAMTGAQAPADAASGPVALGLGAQPGEAGVVARGQAASAAEPMPRKNPGAVKVEFYVMSQCPFGVNVMNKVKGVVDRLGPDIDFTLDFIGTVSEDGTPSSMHGPDEVLGDIAQLCAARYAPSKYLDLIVCQNHNVHEVASNWEACAQTNGLPVESIKACVSGPEGRQLVAESFQRSKDRGARGSPTMFVNGVPYSGRRSASAFLRSFCGTFVQGRPVVCSDLPSAPEVRVTILSDKRCEGCEPTRWDKMLRARLENPVFKSLDYAEAEARALYRSLGDPRAALPLVLFDSSLDSDQEAAGLLRAHLRPLGAYQALSTGGSWIPACLDPKGCSRQECKNTLTCRKEGPRRLELFVMSHCPFGVRALQAMDEVLQAFDKKVDFQVHFIGKGTAEKGLQSMHGEAEVDEDVRELCTMKHYKNYEWMKYVRCRGQDFRSTDWQKCAVDGIDARVIEKCAAGEGRKLLEKDFQIAEGLGIGASPTWVANGTHEFNASGAEEVKARFCGFNGNRIKGCEKTLSGPATTKGGECGK